MFEVIPARPAPSGVVGVRAWLRNNLFSSPANTLLTVVAGLFVGVALVNLIGFIFFDAHWAQVWRNQKLFGAYRYPAELLWRPLAIAAVMMGLLGAMAGASRENEIVRGAFFWITGFVAVVAVVALAFWPSVRLWWTLVVVVAVLGFLLGRAAPRADGSPRRSRPRGAVLPELGPPS